MGTLRLNNGFERYSDPKLLGKTNSIIIALSENFATAPLLPLLMTSRDDFNAKFAASVDGGKVAKAEKDQAREVLIDNLHLMSYYILLTCAGDKTMAAKSGYDISKTPGPAPALTPAQDLATEDGQNSGELKFSFLRVPGAKSYIYMCTPDPLTDASEWTNAMGTTCKHVFTGLQSGKRYWVRVAAVGTDNQLVYSNPILSRIVQ